MQNESPDGLSDENLTPEDIEMLGIWAGEQQADLDHARFLRANSAASRRRLQQRREHTTTKVRAIELTDHELVLVREFVSRLRLYGPQIAHGLIR